LKTMTISRWLQTVWHRLCWWLWGLKRKLTALPSLLSPLARPALYAAIGLLVCGILALVAFTGYRLWAIPAWYLEQHPGTDAQAMNEYRIAMGPVFAGLVQLAGGLLLVIGLVLAWREWRTTRGIALTEEFSRAIDALASAACEVRLSAVYRLERVATESSRDYAAIFEILAHFLKGRLPWRGDDISAIPPLQADAGAAITVLGRLGRIHGRSTWPWSPSARNRPCVPPDLAGADLRRVSLRGAFFQNAVLTGADLTQADLSGANLDGANLSNARLKEARLQDASLCWIKANGADLRSANLAGANLGFAHLFEVCARKACFARAHLENTILGGDFREASFLQADLVCVEGLSGDFRGANLQVNGPGWLFFHRMAPWTYGDERTVMPKDYRTRLPEPSGPHSMLPKCEDHEDV